MANSCCMNNVVATGNWQLHGLRKILHWFAFGLSISPRLILMQSIDSEEVLYRTTGCIIYLYMIN